MANEQGLLIKDADGNLYFLRPEILEAAKVPQGEIKAAPAEVSKHVEALRGKADVAGYAAQADLQSVAGLKVRVVKPNVAKLDLSKVASTVMCPW